MLELKNITKFYGEKDSKVQALNGVSLKFRDKEFVSILGPSGCGKTTLLNIIGGLDQYSSGDLIINGVSTKKYHDADWDTYRNHTIGFVFQSYNLIPHQTVLSNVELALTLSGISAGERRKRAVKALQDVGLTKMHKLPNQMSGGQCQRVAIARALVNEPDILLCDEPTGALDTTTSVQVMNILKKISKTKLVIMVTHNPELAHRYSNRIIRVQDGRIVGDSHPYLGGKEPDLNPLHLLMPKTETESATEKVKKGKKKSMSFFTALGLSLNNLKTKKGRTFMTSFAGSIGIIGIALILSVSTGVNAYIESVQRDTLASYPIQLQAETLDMTGIVNTLMETQQEQEEDKHDRDRVYESAIIANLMNSLTQTETNKNDLKSFKAYLENSEAFQNVLTATQYTYDFSWTTLTKDTDGKVVRSSIMELMSMFYGETSMSMMSSSSLSSLYASYDVWTEVLSEGTEVNDIIKDQYDVIYGHYPTSATEVMLVVDKNNEISDLSLYALGLRTGSEIQAGMLAMSKGEELSTDELKSWSYEEICDMTFRLVLPAECYQLNSDGTYTDRSETDAGLKELYNDPSVGLSITICGILRPSDDASSTSISGSIAYTHALTEYAIEVNQNSTLLQRQLNNPDTDVFLNLPFKTAETVEPTDEEKVEAIKVYLNTLSDRELADIYEDLRYAEVEANVEVQVDNYMATVTDPTAFIVQYLVDNQGMTQEEATATAGQIDDASKISMIRTAVTESMLTPAKETLAGQLASVTDEQKALALKAELVNYTNEQFVALYDDYYPATHSESTYEDNLAKLGYADLDSPSGINLYTASFEDKDTVSELIDEYNNSVEEKKQISYTDYVALLMSSVTTIVDAISYVLIAFVAISLVVSSIMIGIITYISVLERTKEIGILRAIGASKKDVRRVFNAETLIVGFIAGVIGILASLGLIVIINKVLFYYTGLANLKAQLPVVAAFILVGISMFLTFIAGLFPSGYAAKKDPVVALRTE